MLSWSGENTGILQQGSLGDGEDKKFIRNQVALVSLLKDQDIFWISIHRRGNY